MSPRPSRASPQHGSAVLVSELPVPQFPQRQLRLGCARWGWPRGVGCWPGAGAALPGGTPSCWHGGKSRSSGCGEPARCCSGAWGRCHATAGETEAPGGSHRWQRCFPLRQWASRAHVGPHPARAFVGFWGGISRVRGLGLCTSTAPPGTGWSRRHLVLATLRHPRWASGAQLVWCCGMARCCGRWVSRGGGDPGHWQGVGPLGLLGIQDAQWGPGGVVGPGCTG